MLIFICQNFGICCVKYIPLSLLGSNIELSIKFLIQSYLQLCINHILTSFQYSAVLLDYIKIMEGKGWVPIAHIKRKS